MSDWEVWEDEEAVEEDEEVVEEGEEVVESEGEVVESDEVVVWKPPGDPLLSYVYGLSDRPPSSLEGWRWIEVVAEVKRYERMAEEAERRGMLSKAREWRGLASRYAAVAFVHCPYRPRMCPIYSEIVSSCPVGLEERCRPRAWAQARPRPRKLKRHFRGRGRK